MILHSYNFAYFILLNHFSFNVLFSAHVNINNTKQTIVLFKFVYKDEPYYIDLGGPLYDRQSDQKNKKLVHCKYTEIRKFMAEFANL